MNGLNNTDKWRKLMRFLFIVYLIALIIIAIIFYNFSTIVTFFEQKRIDNIIEQIEQNIFDDVSLTREQLPMIIEENNVDLIILNAKELVYSTTSFTDFSQFLEIGNPENISYRKTYKLNRGQNEYQVHLTIYKQYDLYIHRLIVPIIILVVFECLLIGGMFFLMFRKVISPMKKLQLKISQLKDYNFNEAIDNEKEHSLLIKALQEFSNDISDKINTFEVQYTDLEMQLQQNRESTVYRKQLIQSLVHDLKTPLTIATVLNEQLQHSERSQKDNEELQKIAEINEQLAENINEILVLFDQEDLTLHYEEINVVIIIRDIIHLLQPMILDKKVQLEIICEPQIVFTTNKIEIKQIIHNIILNACKYVDVSGKLSVEAYMEKDCFMFRVYNDNAKRDTIDFVHIFDLFYKNSEDNTSSGVGMFVVKNMAEQLGGTVRFVPLDAGVEFWFELPITKKIGG